MGETDINWWLFGLTLVVSAVTSIITAASAPWVIADDAHVERIRASRIYRPVALSLVSVLIAAGAIMLAPASAMVTGWDLILMSLCLGVNAGTTGFLFVVDVIIHRLPDRLVLPLAGTNLGLCVLGLLLGQPRLWQAALVSALVAVGFFACLHLIGRIVRARTMGLGDVKLAVVLGCTAGLYSIWALAWVFVIMVGIAGLWSLFAVVHERRFRGTAIAFGPAMLSGMWLGSVSAPFLL